MVPCSQATGEKSIIISACAMHPASPRLLSTISMWPVSSFQEAAAPPCLLPPRSAHSFRKPGGQGIGYGPQAGAPVDIPMEPRTPPPPGAPASARSPPSSPVSPRRASSEHVQLARELWFLRELARVQAAERTFLADLTRLLRRGVDASAGRVRRDDEWTSALPPEGADVFESFPPPRSPAAPARESAANDLLRDAEVARAQQRVTVRHPASTHTPFASICVRAHTMSQP